MYRKRLFDGLLKNSPTISHFFQSTGHIHGGGHYAISDSGVEVDTLSGDINVYNNYQGPLYRINADTALNLNYINADSIIRDLKYSFSDHLSSNEKFKERGKTSPSGKYSAIYEWITSTHHYFTIRTTDYSAPDYTIYAVADEFQWINDEYILYTGLFTTLPSLLNVKNMEIIRLIPGIDEIDYDYGSSEYNFSIEEIKNNVIILKDNNAEGKEDGQIFWEFDLNEISNS
jgi:hypothetical protein